MEKLADFDNTIVKQKIEDLIRGCQSDEDKIKKIFLYVRDEIKFGFPLKSDIMKASETIKLGYGQCNTKSTLFLALCKSIDIPARIHFSTIKKEIQKGIFTGFTYRLLPAELSHSWVEINIGNKWIRIDSYINDIEFYKAGKEELKKRNWKTGFSISCSKNNSSIDLDLKNEKFVQMDAVIDDHGIWDDPIDYYQTKNYKNKPGFFKAIIYRLLINKINKRVQKLRCQNLFTKE